MNTQLIDKLAVTIQKINYLYTGIRKSKTEAKKLEMALLKQYILELYDGVLDLENEHQPTVSAYTTPESARGIESLLPPVTKNTETVLPVVTTPEIVPEEPVIEEPKVTEPEIEEPKVEEPNIEEPKIENEPEPEIVPEPEPEVEPAPEIVASEPEPIQESVISMPPTPEMMRFEQKMEDMNLQEEPIEGLMDGKETIVEEKLEFIEETIRELKTSVLGNIREVQEQSERLLEDPPPVAEIPEPEVMTSFNFRDDESSKTQILDNFINRENFGEMDNSVSIYTEDDDDLPAEDETIPLELNDILFQKEKPKSITANGDNGAGENNGATFDISFNQRFAFINQLFGGDSNAYTKSIAELGQSKGYIEALTYINLNLRHDYKWKEKDETVKDFLDVIKKNFLG